MNNNHEETRFSNALPSAIADEMKRCAKCGEKQPVSEFNIDQGKKDGR